MSKTHLKVGVRGRAPIIDGDLFDEVAINEEATWMLVDRTVVNVILPKVSICKKCQLIPFFLEKAHRILEEVDYHGSGSQHQKDDH